MAGCRLAAAGALRRPLEIFLGERGRDVFLGPGREKKERSLEEQNRGGGIFD